MARTSGVFFRLGDKGTWQPMLVELCETGDYWPGELGRRGKSVCFLVLGRRARGAQGA